MGEFAFGIYAYKTKKSQVLEVLPSILRQSGFTLCSNEESDRAIAVVSLGDWIGVYDSEYYADSLNKPFSASFDMPCVSIDLQDGDCLETALWKNGKREDLYISHPLCIERRRSKNNCGNTEKWTAVTDKTAALKELFTGDGGATDKMFELSEILGFPQDFAIMQYTFLKEIENSEISYLYFREAGEKPAVPEAPVFLWQSGGYAIPVNRELETMSVKKGLPKHVLRVGDVFSVESNFVNTGRSCRGITVYIAGGNVENKSVIYDKLEIYEGYLPRNKLIAQVNLKEILSSDGRNCFGIRLDDFEFPHGMTSEEKTRAEKLKKPVTDIHFAFNAYGTLLRSDDFPDSSIFIHPNENFKAGYASRFLMRGTVFKP